MITLKFSPVRSDVKTEASLSGTTLTVNGQPFNLSEIPAGASGTHETLVAFSRDGNSYEITINLTHGAAAPHETRFPEPVTISDGWVLDYVFDEEVISDLVE